MERTYLMLPNEDKLPLPFHWNEEEFSLPGNCEVHLDGRLVAVYDETSRTGAIWCAIPRPYWSIVQPFLREDFFKRHVPECVASLAGSS